MDSSETSGLKRVFPPTAATEVLHALIWPFLASVGSSLESQVSTLSCRQPIPPLALTYLAYASMASMLPWNNPGASGDPVSAITCTVMVSAVTPVSVASSVTPSHAALATAVVAVPPPPVDAFSEPLRPQAAANKPIATSTYSRRCRFTRPPGFDVDFNYEGATLSEIVRKCLDLSTATGQRNEAWPGPTYFTATG